MRSLGGEKNMFFISRFSVFFLISLQIDFFLLVSSTVWGHDEVWDVCVCVGCVGCVCVGGDVCVCGVCVGCVCGRGVGGGVCGGGVCVGCVCGVCVGGGCVCVYGGMCVCVC